MSQHRNWKSLIQDLKERKVFRSVLAYLVAGWVVIQVGDVLLPIYDAPRWALQALVTLVLIGFPLFVVLSWSYDFTKTGLRRTERDTATSRVLRRSGARAALAGTLILVTAVVVWWVWAAYYASLPDRISRSAQSGTPVVAVAAFENLTGDKAYDWLSVAFANLARDNLAQSRHLVVTSRRLLDTLLRQAGDGSDPHDAISDAGIGYVVSGEFIKAPDGLTLTARVTDLEGGVNLIAQSFKDLTPEEMIPLADRVATLTKQGLGAPHTEEVVRFASDFVVDNMAAYEAFIGGLQSFVDFDYKAAGRAFQTSLELAPDFHMARYYLAAVHDSTGRTSQALKMLDQIPDGAVLSPRERLLIDAAKAKFARDSEKAVAIYRELFEQFPYDIEAGQLLAEAYWNNFEEDKAIAQLRKLIELEPENPAGYMALGERLVELGDLDEARPVLEKYVDLLPGDPYGHTLLGDLAQLDGNPELALGHYEDALNDSAGFPLATLGVARSDYLLGNPDRAEESWRRVVEDPDAEPANRIDAAFDLTGFLRGQRRFEEALQPLSSLESEIREEQIREAMALSTLALTHVELGEEGRAGELIEIAIERSPIVPTRYLFARGQLEERLELPESVRATAAEIRSHALPPDDPDRTEDKAAAYLEGRAALLESDADTAIALFETAIGLDGYRYAIYELGLAEAHAAAGNRQKAVTIALDASTHRDPGDLRLDLELERVRAAELAESLSSD